jgi:hypothetical protein
VQARRRWQLAIAALGATTLLAACSTSTTANSGGPAPSVPDAPAAGPSASCAQLTALGRALANVSHIAVSAKMRSTVSADLRTIDRALTPLNSDAQSVYTAEAGQIAAALTVIDNEAQLLSLRPTATNLRVTKIAVKALKKTVNSVTTELRIDCPSS